MFVMKRTVLIVKDANRRGTMEKNPDTKIKGKKIRFETYRTKSGTSSSKTFFVKFFKILFSLRVYRGNQNIQLSLTWKDTESTPDKGGNLEVWREYQETESPLEARTFH